MTLGLPNKLTMTLNLVKVICHVLIFFFGIIKFQKGIIVPKPLLYKALPYGCVEIYCCIMKLRDISLKESQFRMSQKSKNQIIFLTICFLLNVV